MSPLEPRFGLSSEFGGWPGPSQSFELTRGALSKLCLGGPAKRLDASLLLERYLPALSAAWSTGTRFLFGGLILLHNDGPTRQVH
jgi:hypothetical protein